MKRVVIGIVAIIVATLTAGGPTAASASYVFGPYRVVSPDSGTCGNDWATDTFTRRFVVQANADGTYAVTVLNTDGVFVTIAGASPGGCEAGGRHGSSIAGGLSGKMHGTVAGRVRGGAFDATATCAEPCYMGTFVASFFGSGATFEVTDFAFEYSSGARDLAYRQWTNASRGNTGDIASH